ncbi:glycosyltransferase family 1 protein [Pseudoxanthomonas sp. SGD-10]|nr:glycosyltransferase family 1 protein [Pseudoxanthomonas sp. SGD-10]
MNVARRDKLGVWFPSIRTGTGTDVFTEQLAQNLESAGIRAAIDWLPLRAEYAPWTVHPPCPPSWANVCHVNTWLHPRFIPRHLPVVATLHHAVHDPALRPHKGGLRAGYHRFWISPIERRVLKRADRVVAVSQFASEMARKTLIDVPMQVIHNGIDTTAFQPGVRTRQPHEPFRLLYVGSWMARKGVDLLAPIMRELGEGFELRYTGGPAADRDRPSMPPNMHDVGHLQPPQVAYAMQNADAFLFPSRSEGFGLVVAEAMACGLPVITTRCSALPEVVQDGTTGFLCPINDVHSFAIAAKRLAEDRELLRTMSGQARRHAVANFSIENMINAYIDAYSRCLDDTAG